MLRKVLFAACAFIVSTVVAVPIATQGQVARADFDYKSAALTFVAQQWDVNPQTALQFEALVSEAGQTVASLRQAQNGFSIDNTFANVTFDQNNIVVDFQGQKADFEFVFQNMPSILPDDAIQAGQQALPNSTYTGTWDNDFAYLAIPNAAPSGDATALVFNYVIDLEDNTGTVYAAYVDARNAEVRQISNQ